ncbi:MAG: hypothetical protein HEP71_11100 [Roseivirga sp.]|nr:hypothetical protein [Roseivirga sp.]
MNQARYWHFITGLLFVSAGFLSKIVYRPFVYSNGFEDLGFSNSSPSLLYVIGFSFLLSINPQFKVLYVTTIVTLNSILFEVYQSLGDSPFDTTDTVYSIIGGVLTLLIHSRLRKIRRYASRNTNS